MLDQTFPLACEDVKLTEPPVQNDVGPSAEIAGTAGKVFTVTAVFVDVAEQPFPSV